MRHLGARSFAALAALAGLSAIGCAGPQRVNPSFNISSQDAEQQIELMRQKPKQLERPLVILGGIGDLGAGPWRMRREIESTFSGRALTVVYPFASNFEQCRREVVEAVDRAFGVVSDEETVEVDVVGQSMGGVVALHAAMSDPALGKRLRIRRLYTISSPLNGSRGANAFAWASPIQLHRDLRSDSELQKRLHRQDFKFEIVSYSRLNDDTVGAPFAYLPDARGVWWVDNPPFENAHAGCFDDARIVGDIARRLRRERPFTTGTPAPLPEEELR
jgi:pimeloyl-ACP methyl ester carboxylesterase